MARETVRIEGLAGVLDTLKSLPPEIVSKRGGPVRKALRRAAVQMVLAAKLNVQKIIDTPNVGGMPTRSIGHLKKNIYTMRGRKMRAKGELYLIGVRPKVYPDEFGNNVTAQKVGALLEHGTETRRPMPWMRPAFDANKHQVVQFFAAELNKDLDRIVRKLARQNGVA